MNEGYYKPNPKLKYNVGAKGVHVLAVVGYGKVSYGNTSKDDGIPAKLYDFIKVPSWPLWSESILTAAALQFSRTMTPQALNRRRVSKPRRIPIWTFSKFLNTARS